MKRERYIELMDKALSAYTVEHMRRYLAEVRRDGLTEHGFARLASNLGILIAHGYRRELLPLFIEMMDFCCQSFPKVKAANDFTVKEVIFCLMELENSDVDLQEKIAEWKALLATIQVENTYTVYAKEPTDKVYNWACFTAVSEWMRQYIGLAHTEDFVDVQIASQLQWLDDNGMYRDPNEPMVYDSVTRGLFAVLLHFGYKGKYFKEMDDCLRQAGLLSLKMQSVTGELAFGGRSNQFLHNEAHLALLAEFEANRYAKEGNMQLAGQFKASVEEAITLMGSWLEKERITHIKNRYPTGDLYGCEGYGYFNKYMITTASFIYVAYLMSDDSIPVVPKDETPYVFSTSEHFHKTFMHAGDYFLEFETKADPHYDSSGLGRVHKKGANSMVCINLPCAAEPVYHLDMESVDGSMAVGYRDEAGLHFALTRDTVYERTTAYATPFNAKVAFICHFPEGKEVRSSYTVDNNGVEIEVTGEGDVAFMLPAFAFDGEKDTQITAEEHSLTVQYGGSTSRITTDGVITDLQQTACSRNGHHKLFAAEGKNTLKLKIEIL